MVRKGIPSFTSRAGESEEYDDKDEQDGYHEQDLLPEQ